MPELAPRAPRILISGYFGFANAGDEAILAAMIDALRQQVPGVELTVISGEPEQTRQELGVETVGRGDVVGLLRKLRWADLLLSGGGSVLQDVTSSRSILYYLGVVGLAQLLGTPVMFYAQGVGPIRRRVNRWLTARLANRVKLITVREEGSLCVLEKLGVKRPPVEVTADQVFCLEPTSPAAARSLLEAEGVVFDGRPLVGIALRPWEEAEQLPGVVAEAADALAEEYGAQVVFLPFQAGADRPVALEAANRMRHRAVVLSGAYKPREMMGITGLMHLVIGMRLHALVFGAAQGVPLVGIIYDPKVSDFLQLVQQPDAGPAAELDGPGLLEACRQALGDRENLVRRLQATGGELCRRARENSRLAASLLPGYGRES